MRSQKIGLLGGSFNPAHAGHLYISETALRILNLDQVWWLVSPQNPLKSSEGMGSAEDRISSAKAVIHNPRIKISTFEFELGQTYTAKTISALKRSYPDHQFVWLMGADNLIQIPRWHQWQSIFETVPIAVFDRPGYTFKALNGKAARIYSESRWFPSGHNRPISDFSGATAPAWTFISHTKHKLSSTEIRNIRDR